MKIEYDQLRQTFEQLTIQCQQLNEANQAWQQYQHNQLLLFRHRLNLPMDDNLSFDNILQQIENRFNQLQNENESLVKRIIQFESTITNRN